MPGPKKFSRMECRPGDTVLVERSGLWMVLNVACGCGSTACQETGNKCGMTQVTFIAPRVPMNADNPSGPMNATVRTLNAPDGRPFKGTYMPVTRSK